MTGLRQWIARAGKGTWNHWPGTAYARPGYLQRLAAVERHLAEAIESAPAGPVRIVSICAGDGRDVLSVVESHSRRDDVTAWLVELDGSSVTAGLARAQRAGLEHSVQFLHRDATSFATYRDIAPVDILLVSGVWGHVPPEDRTSLVRGCGILCRTGATVIWTRGIRRGRERFETIRALFTNPTWDEARTTFTPDAKWAVATHRFLGTRCELPTHGRLFRFQTASGR